MLPRVDRAGLTALDRQWLFLIAALTLPYYMVVVARDVGTLFPPTYAGLTFNSMAEHLLRFRFDVDPVAVTHEGFLRDGRVYSYFGILPALLRWPLRPFFDLTQTDLTALMCVIAAWLGGVVRIATILAIRRSLPETPMRKRVVTGLVLITVFAGAQAPYLRASVYQEVASWASLFAAIFVYRAVTTLISGQGFTMRDLLVMASAAGCALLTRVSTGLGLYVALGLLLAYQAWPKSGAYSGRLLSWLGQLMRPRNLAVAAVLLAAVLACGIVNHFRWDRFWVFVDYRLHEMNIRYPDRPARLEAYGFFNVERLPYGVMYYFFPLWAFTDATGRMLFSDFQERLIDAAEMPPASFLLTDPLLVLLFGCLLRYWRAAGARMAEAGPLMLGMAVPPLLMLSAIYFAFRYRLEFYPLLEFGAFLGAWLVCARTGATRPARTFGWALSGSVVVGIVVSQVTMRCHIAAIFGPASVFHAKGLLNGGPIPYCLASVGLQ